MTNFNIKNFVLDSISRYSLPIVIHSYADLEAEIQSNLEKKRQAKLELLRFDTGLPGIIIEKISHKDPLELTHNYIKIEDSGQKIDDLIHELVWTLTQKKITINCQNREENLKHCLKLTKDLIDSQESETILIQNSAITPKKRFDKSRAGKSQVSKNMNKIGIEILDESIRTLQQISDKSVDHNKISDIIETKNSLKSQFEALVIDPKTADLLQFLIDIEKSKQKALNTLQSSNEKHFITNQCKQNLQLLGILAQNNPGLITNLKEISEQNSNLTYDLLLKLNQEIALQISNFSAEIENKRKLDDLDRPKIDERNEGLDLTNIDKLSDLIETDKQLPIKPTNLDLDAFTYVEDCKNHIFIMYLSGELLSHFLPGDEHIIQKIKEKLTKIPVYSPQKLMSLSSKIDAVIVSFCAKIHQISSQEIFKKAEKIRNIFESHKQKLMIPKIAHMISNKLPGQKQEITFENIQIIEEEQCKAIPILFTLTKFFGNIEDQFKA